jgi:hypothetical protein
VNQLKFVSKNEIIISSSKRFLLLDNHNNVERNRLGKTFLLNNNTFDADKSDYVRPTIVINDDTSKLSPIASAES